MKIIILLIAITLCGCSIYSNNENKQVLCYSPLEVLGESSDLGYIVFLYDGVEPDTYATQLTEAFGSSVNIYSTGTSINYFGAKLTPEAIEMIRCDSSVKSIYYEEELSTTSS